MIIDTDGAADDLRTICMLLGNREVEILAVTTSEGALLPDNAADKVSSLLGYFHHQGIPVGVGRTIGTAVPVWRAHSEQIRWGEAVNSSGNYQSAQMLITETIENEEEKVVLICLGALTNLYDVLEEKPALGARIDQVIWYSSQAEPLAGANYLTDTLSARGVLASGVEMAIVSANHQHPMVVSRSFLDSIAAVNTPYARKIAQTHGTSPLAQLVDEGHLKAWDEQAAAYLFAPELFVCRTIGGTVKTCSLPDQVSTAKAQSKILSILRGKPDAESRVLYGFPVLHQLYAADVVPIIDEAVARHGLSEWRAGVLTNELHGHLGIYATIGVKMGIRAREYFNIGVDDILVTTYAGSKPPISCMNDGLQVSTGATIGHGLITVAAGESVRPEARFSFKGKTIRLSLKPAYARRIREDVQKGIELHGDLTEAYWQYVRELALRYWLDFDRHEIFDMHIEK